MFVKISYVYIPPLINCIGIFTLTQNMEKHMQIPVIKTELASALTALGKLVSRTSLIKAYQGIEIEGKARSL